MFGCNEILFAKGWPTKVVSMPTFSKKGFSWGKIENIWLVDFLIL
jgi:hypothetical protein